MSKWISYDYECDLECLKCGARYRDWIEFANPGVIAVALCSACNCVSEAYIHKVLK